MDTFVRKEGSAKMIFHHKTMFKNPQGRTHSIGSTDANVPLSCDIPPFKLSDAATFSWGATARPSKWVSIPNFAMMVPTAKRSDNGFQFTLRHAAIRRVWTMAVPVAVATATKLHTLVANGFAAICGAAHIWLVDHGKMLPS